MHHENKTKVFDIFERKKNSSLVRVMKNKNKTNKSLLVNNIVIIVLVIVIYKNAGMVELVNCLPTHNG